MRVGLAVSLLALFVAFAPAGDGDQKKDARLGPPRHYDLKYFPWTPPTSKAAWEAERQRVREKILVATGLWPMPEKTPLNAVIHGKIERDGYTIEKVFFASYPGHYVSGNLYRPTGKTGKLPAILSPHGHWANGRFYEANDKEVAAQLKSGAEQTKDSAKYPLQARCAQLARLGCVVFHYDMVGNADSRQIEHRKGFTDVEAELRLQNFMGLQTWNSIRALDFLCGLPDVDPSRIGVTGASGGGTQTFILCAIDDRPAAAFPAVMVGTAMQGGCVCENCSYLRIDGNNVQIAACMAPRPLGMTGAEDWTKDIMTKGLPELKQVYSLYGAADNVKAEAHREFGHNYNQVSREIMYNFFNKHLKLGHEGTIREQSFVPVPPKELSVYDADHPRPSDATNAEGLRRYLTEQSEKQMAALLPKDTASLTEFVKVMRPALRTMVADSLPNSADVVGERQAQSVVPGGAVFSRQTVGREGSGERVLLEYWIPPKSGGRCVVWVHPDGRGSITSKEFKKAMAMNAGVCVVEVLRTGATANEKAAAVNKTFAGYTFGYNRPLVAERVHDILTAVAWATGRKGVESVDLVGFGKAGPWVALARGLCHEKVRRTAADMNDFRFEQVNDCNDEMMLPGGLKYGGLLTLAAVAAPHEMLLHNTKGCGSARFLTAAYQTAGHADRLQLREDAMAPDAVVEWLLR
jgi:dienelactone hydrolase